MVWGSDMSDAVRSDPRAERKKRLQDFHREHILAAALRLIERGGLECLNMEDVAREAGFSVGSLYNYYRSKDALAVELLVAKTAEVEAAMEVDAPAGLGPKEALTWHVALVLEKIRQSKGVLIDLVLLIHEAGFRSAGLDHQKIHALMMAQEGRLTDLVSRVLGNTTLSVPVEDAGCALGGLIRAFVAREMAAPGGPEGDSQSMATRIVDLLWSGVGPKN